jgi:tetratricopeptide (TPR) repeat protein
MFYLLAFLLYLVGRGAPVAWKRWSLLGAGFVAWGLALGSKEIAATLPFAVLLCEWFFFQYLDRRWLRRHLGMLAVLLAVFAGVALLYLGASPLDRVLDGYARRDFTMGERLLTQPRVICLYLGLLLVPLPGRFNLLHDVAASHSLVDPPTTLLAFAALAAILAAAVWIATRRPLVSFGILWIFLHLAIESSFIPLELVFEHRMYLPMAGFALLLTDPLSRLPARAFSRVAVAGLLVVAALAAASAARNRVWRDEVTLWEDVVAKYPESHRAHNNLGLALERQDRRQEAIPHYRRALELDPRAAQVHNNLGHALAEAGRHEEALRHLERALRLNPSAAAAHNNMGVALVEEGRIPEALRHYAEALRIDPDFARAHYNSAVALEEQGRFDEATRHYREALRAAPDFAPAHNNLGRALSRRGDREGALRHFREALRIDPGSSEAHNNLGLALAHGGDFAGALRHYAEALRIRPDYATAHNNLGVTLARQGRLAEAVERFEKALRLEPDYGEAKRNLLQARRLLIDSQ